MALNSMASSSSVLHPQLSFTLPRYSRPPTASSLPLSSSSDSPLPSSSSLSISPSIRALPRAGNPNPNTKVPNLDFDPNLSSFYLLCLDKGSHFPAEIEGELLGQNRAAEGDDLRRSGVRQRDSVPVDR